MASTYHSRPLVPEVIVKGNRYAIVRDRQSIEALINADRLPPWFDKGELSRAGAASAGISTSPARLRGPNLPMMDVRG